MEQNSSKANESFRSAASIAACGAVAAVGLAAFLFWPRTQAADATPGYAGNNAQVITKLFPVSRVDNSSISIHCKEALITSHRGTVDLLLAQGKAADTRRQEVAAECEQRFGVRPSWAPAP